MTTTNQTSDSPTWQHDQLIHARWVAPGRLLAGEYPGSLDPEVAARKRQALVDAGIDSMVNLTEVGESTWGGVPLAPYDDLMVTQAGTRGVSINHARFAIPDNNVIDHAGYNQILDHIRCELDSGKVVYVHCWGGKGRTGTVIGAWLIDQEGLTYAQTLRRMQELRRGTKKYRQPVPESEVQHHLLRQRAQPKDQWK